MLFQLPVKLSRKKSLKERIKYRKSNNNDQECGRCDFMKIKSSGSWSGFKCLKMGIGQSSPDIKVNYVCDYFLKAGI